MNIPEVFQESFSLGMRKNSPVWDETGPHHEVAGVVLPSATPMGDTMRWFQVITFDPKITGRRD
jgi:hypothetical protein